MPHELRAHGLRLFRLYPYRRHERLAAGWVTQLEHGEAVLVHRQGRHWQVSPWAQRWYYNEDGEYVAEPLSMQDRPVACALTVQRFPTRRAALQALSVCAELAGAGPAPTRLGQE